MFFFFVGSNWINEKKVWGSFEWVFIEIDLIVIFDFVFEGNLLILIVSSRCVLIKFLGQQQQKMKERWKFEQQEKKTKKPKNTRNK